MNIPDHISKSLETIFCVKILKFFDADPGFGIFLTLDPGSGMEKNSDPGSEINIPDPQHCKQIIPMPNVAWVKLRRLKAPIFSRRFASTSRSVSFRNLRRMVTAKGPERSAASPSLV
jgi:hypothetical protein